MTDGVLTIGNVLDRLSFGLLTYAAGALDPAAAVTAVTTGDGYDQPDARVGGALVLGIGLHEPEQIVRTIERFGGLDATALVIRAPFAVTAEVAAALKAHGLALLCLEPGVSWIRLATMIDSDLEHLRGGASAGPLGEGGADLYDVANSLSGLLGGPVTIEDLSSRILAFSSDQDTADEPRKESILGRRVSRRNNERLARSGIFKAVFSSPRPVFVRPDVERSRPRAVMRIQAGEEALGSIWAVVDRPLTVAQEHGFVEGANIVALTLIRHRLAEDAGVRMRASMVSRLLEGGAGAHEAAQQLGTAGSACFVMAIARAGDDETGAGEEAALQSLAKVFATFIASVSPRAVIAPIGRTLYAVVPVAETRGTVQSHDRRAAPSHDGGHAADALRIARDLLRRAPEEGRLRAGIGDPVDDVSGLAGARRQADAALRVLRLGARRGSPRRVAYWRDVQVDSLLLEVADSMAIRHESVAHPLERLIAADTAGELAPTLEAYLESFGDVTAAAASLHVHPNTFRYRLRKIATVAGIDLADPDTRFGLMFQSRLSRSLPDCSMGQRTSRRLSRPDDEPAGAIGNCG